MNPKTLVAICGYQGDLPLALMLRPIHEAHKCPILVLSPTDSPITSYGPHLCQHAGKRAYIGQDSLDRQIEYMKLCLSHKDFDFFLLNDADSCVLSAGLPREWYDSAHPTLWSNHVVDPRAHQTPYPRLAFQPPYFMSRVAMELLLSVAPKCETSAVTPFVDHFMMQMAYNARHKLRCRYFGELEHEPTVHRPPGDNPWLHTEFRVRHQGCVTQHPIKSFLQLKLVENARIEYEREHSKS